MIIATFIDTFDNENVTSRRYISTTGPLTIT